MQTHVFRYFFIPYLFFLILGAMYVLLNKHGDAVLWMNSIHSEALNYFFKAWTHGGDAISFGIIAILLLFFRRRFGYVFLLVGLVQGLISWVMKTVIFSDTPRPGRYFEEGALDLINGVELKDFNSFPSGHTMTAFAMAAFLTFVMAKREWAVTLLIAAVLVGISRIYLNQHFMIDVVAGSFIGVVVSLAGYKSFEKYLELER